MLKGRTALDRRPGETLPAVDLAVVRTEVEQKVRRQISEQEVLSYLMYPKVFLEFAAFERKFTDVSMIPTDVAFYGLRIGEETEVEIERGKTLFIKLVAVSEPNEQGVRTLFFELNGHPREVQVHDRRSGREAKTRLKADRDNLHHLGSPMPGTVIDIKVKPGQEVREHERLLTIEAMKMEMALTSPITGVIKEVIVGPSERVDTGDLLIVFQ